MKFCVPTIEYIIYDETNSSDILDFLTRNIEDADFNPTAFELISEVDGVVTFRHSIDPWGPTDIVLNIGDYLVSSGNGSSSLSVELFNNRYQVLPNGT